MVPKQRQRRAIGHPGTPTSLVGAPNEVWSADVKGHFKTGDGRYCYPLTITDGYSRFLLACQALSSTRVQEAKPVFTRVFKAFGRPQRIRTDNGVPFATNTLGRLSQLSAWWVRLGILPEFIAILYLDVAGAGYGSRILHRASFTGHSVYNTFALRFKVRAPGNMEYRVLPVSSRGEFWVDYIAILKANALAGRVRKSLTAPNPSWQGTRRRRRAAEGPR